MAGKRTFVCFAAEDAFRAVPIVAALDAWEVAHTELDATLLPGQDLPAWWRQAIEDCDVFLRLCTGATAASEPVTRATDMFRQLLEEDRRRKRRSRRALINLILDSAYVNDPRDASRLYISTANKERSLWLEELAIPLGVGTIAQRVTRRAVLGMGAGAALAVVASAGAGALLVNQQQQQAQANQPVPVSRSSGQPFATFTLSDTPATDNLDVPLVAADGDQVYAIAGSTVYHLSLADSTFKPLDLHFQLDNVFNSNATALLAAAQGLLIVRAAAPLDSTGLPIGKNAYSMCVVNASTSKLLWKVSLGDSDWPVIANGMLYSIIFMDDPTGTSNIGNSYVSAFQLATGTLVWQKLIRALPYSAGGGGIRNYPLLSVDAQHVYAGSTDHMLHCFDAHTGAPRWQFQAGGVVRGSVVSGNTVYASCEDYSLYALDTNTGKLRWSFATNGGINAPAAVSAGAVYVGSGDGFVYGLDGATGKQYWKNYAGDDFIHESNHQIVTSPVVYRDIVFVAYSTDLFAFNLEQGKSRWTYIPLQTPPYGVTNQPVIAGGLVVYGSSHQKVFAINP